MDIRNTYLIFPNFTQHFITWMTGKSLSNQKPKINLNWLNYFMINFSSFIIGICGGYLNFVTIQDTTLMILSWCLVLAGSRRLAAIVLHQCVHLKYSHSKKLDKFIGELVTTLMMTQDFLSYKDDHCKNHHNPKIFSTPDDPIVIFFSKFGFKSGLKKRRLYTLLLLNIFSIRFHLLFFAIRLKYNLTSKSPIRAASSIMYYFFWAWVIYNTQNGLLMFLVVFFIPQVILYQISAILEIFSEHAWLKPHTGNSQKPPHPDRSWGRFCGSRYPNKGILKKLAWYILQIFYHLPVRLFILVGDLPQHDYHHRRTQGKTWSTAAYRRQYDIDNLDSDRPSYIDIWGLHNAISHVFDIMSSEYSHKDKASKKSMLDLTPS